jgi:hypothetical protein
MESSGDKSSRVMEGGSGDMLLNPKKSERIKALG